MKNKSMLGSSIAASLAVVLAANTAHAQAAGGDTAVAQSLSPQSTADIVVTATKRSESLQKVPIQISVITPQAIIDRGITQASQFLSTTSNVTFIEDNAGEAYINIRGQTAVRASDPNVAVVIDGVTLSSLKPFNRNIFGIQQIEVVKGPQTALYGRNAAAGAIVITTKTPGDHLQGEASFGYGKFDTIRAEGAVSGPLVGDLGFSFAASTQHTNGPFKSVTSDSYVYRSNNDSFRGRLYYDNHNNFVVDLKADFFKTSGNGISYNAQFIGVPYQGYNGGPLSTTVFPAFVSNIAGTNQNKFYGLTLKMEYDLGPAKLTSISGYNKYNEYFGGDGIPYLPDTGTGSTVTQYTVHDTNYSQELRLTSTGNTRFRWQVGGSFLRFNRNATSRVSTDDLGILPADPRGIIAPGLPEQTTAFGHPLYTTTDYAAFANAQFDILDNLTLSAAGRYDIERRTVAEVAPIPYNTCVSLNNIPIADCHSAKTFKEFSPKATLSYRPISGVMVYATYGKGFKSGGFNPIGSRAATINATPPDLQSSIYVKDVYTPEKSTSYEVGSKVTLMHGALVLSGALWKTDVTGAQQFQFFPSTGLQTTISIDKVKLKGFDGGIDWTSPIKTLVSVGLGYVDGKVAAFAGNPADVGNVAPGSTKYTINIAVAQPFELSPNYQLVPRVEFNRYGRIWWDVDNTPGTRRAPLNIVNGRITLKNIHGWQLAGYVNNAFNKKYYQEIVPLLPVLTVNFRGLTRSFGIEGRVDF
jgi:iron complex outermembrane receptor protein